ncbi:hypothetical protein LMxysn_0097 [Listeria monocytogenes]|nr:hypothetical protein LMxysn_0097 [Listeria monocytogenes]
MSSIGGTIFKEWLNKFLKNKLTRPILDELFSEKFYDIIG